jgi:hypothetical protein
MTTVELSRGRDDQCRKVIAIVAFAMLLVAAHVGVTSASSFPVVVEKLGATAAACGISESQLEAVALRTVGASDLQPDADSGGQLYLRIAVTQARRASCSARLSVQMKAIEKPSPSLAGTAKQRSRQPTVVLCSKSGDASAPKNSFPLELESVIEYYVGQCLNSLKY